MHQITTDEIISKTVQIFAIKHLKSLICEKLLANACVLTIMWPDKMFNDRKTLCSFLMWVKFGAQSRKDPFTNKWTPNFPQEAKPLSRDEKPHVDDLCLSGEQP